MAKNIYSITGYSSTQQGIFTNVETSSLKIDGGSKGDILMIGDSNGNVDGLTLATTNDVLVANPSGNNLPGYTNALNVNTVSCNDLKINGLLNGDLIVGKTNDYVDRLPIGGSGKVLTSDGSTPFWQDIILPDPLTLQDIVLTNSLKLNYLTNGVLFTDNTGLIVKDRPTYGTSTIPVTFTGSTVIYSINANIILNRNYKVTLSWNNLISSGGNNTYTLTITGQTPITYVTFDSSSQENMSTAFLSGFSGVCTISLTGAHSGGSGGANGTANKVFIICEPLGY